MERRIWRVFGAGTSVFFDLEMNRFTLGGVKAVVLIGKPPFGPILPLQSVCVTLSVHVCLLGWLLVLFLSLLHALTRTLRCVCPHREFQYIVQRIPKEHARRHKLDENVFAVSIYRYYAMPKYVLVVMVWCACGTVR